MTNSTLCIERKHTHSLSGNTHTHTLKTLHNDTCGLCSLLSALIPVRVYLVVGTPTMTLMESMMKN